MAPRLSIIIPAYNCADYLGQCLDSIADPGGAGPSDDVEVVVVDDGSTGLKWKNFIFTSLKATAPKAHFCPWVQGLS